MEQRGRQLLWSASAVWNRQGAPLLPLVSDIVRV